MKSIRLINVKAFNDTGTIDIAPITIVVGRNSCGKSSFIRMPVVLSQTFKSGAETPICLNGSQADFIDYGNFEDVLHNHQGDHFSIVIEYSFDISSYNSRPQNRVIRKRRHDNNADNPDTIALAISFSKPDQKRVYASQIDLLINRELFSQFKKIGATRKYIFTQKKAICDGKLIDVDYRYQIIADDIQNFMPVFDMEIPVAIAAAIYEAITGEKPDEEELNRIVTLIVRYRRMDSSFPEAFKAEKDILNSKSNDARIIEWYNAFDISARLFGEVFYYIEPEFLNLHYIGPIRSAPKRMYRNDENEHVDVGTYGDYTSALLFNDAKEKGTLVKAVSDWLNEVLDYTVEINEIEKTGYYQISAKDSTTHSSANLIDVGYGISQVLPIVTQVKYSYIGNASWRKWRSTIPKQELFVIEQPELHLHPAGQAGLAQLFASNVIRKQDRNKTFFIETHSEHFIRALQVLIADPDYPLTSDMVKIYYVDKTCDGNSTIREIRMNECGQFIDRWPEGFFDKAYNLTKQFMLFTAQRKMTSEKRTDK